MPSMQPMKLEQSFPLPDDRALGTELFLPQGLQFFHVFLPDPAFCIAAIHAHIHCGAE